MSSISYGKSTERYDKSFPKTSKIFFTIVYPICTANQLTGSSVRATLALNGLKPMPYFVPMIPSILESSKLVTHLPSHKQRKESLITL